MRSQACSVSEWRGVSAIIAVSPREGDAKSGGRELERRTLIRMFHCLLILITNQTSIYTPLDTLRGKGEKRLGVLGLSHYLLIFPTSPGWPGYADDPTSSNHGTIPPLPLREHRSLSLNQNRPVWIATNPPRVWNCRVHWTPVGLHVVYPVLPTNS